MTVIAEELDYVTRIAKLREIKLRQTQEKIDQAGSINADDHGRIMPPQGWQWKPIPNHSNGSFYGYQGYSTNFYDLMSKYPVYVEPLDAMAGKWVTSLAWLKGGPGFNPDFDFSHLLPDIEKYNLIHGIGGDQHFGPDYQIGLSLGWAGLREKIAKYRALNPPECAAFYDAEDQVIRGVQLWIDRTIARIRQLLESGEYPALQANLRAMETTNRRIRNHPPATLREACQWLCWFNMVSRSYNGDGAGGQLDEILRPYYERDIATGRITDDEAIYYIACLLLNDTHYYQLSGPDKYGKDQTSKISYLILESAKLINSSCNLTIRVHEGIDKEFLHKAVRYLFECGNGWPRFSGDQALTEGFMRAGYSLELARQRIAVGCNWMSLPGLEYTLNDVVKINVARVFQVAWEEMLIMGQRSPTSLPESPEKALSQVTEANTRHCSTHLLWEIFCRHLQRAVQAIGRGMDFHLRHQARNEPELLLNLLSHGPLEKGRDITDGGAMYYNLAIDGAGIATVSDSFAALSEQIENRRRLTWSQIAQQITNNYADSDGEYVRQILLNSPRYGAGNSGSQINPAEDWGRKISKFFTQEVRNLNERYPGRNFIPGWFSWANTLGFGQAVKATPDGRRAKEPISHGANPSPRFRQDGAVTSLINIITDIQPGYGNTAPIQLEFDPHLAVTDEAVDKIVAMIRAMFARGATLLNINILDAEKILAAHENPALYPDLVVRVTGFTAYFALLSREFRQLVVDRLLEAN